MDERDKSVATGSCPGEPARARMRLHLPFETHTAPSAMTAIPCRPSRARVGCYAGRSRLSAGFGNGNPVHAFPIDGRCERRPSHFFQMKVTCASKASSRATVAKATVVAAVTPLLQPQCLLLFLERRVPVTATPLGDALQRPTEAVLRRWFPHHPLAGETLAPVDGESEKVEAFGPARPIVASASV